jgi:tetratricopeptide (TPR) repeat protein
MMKNCTLTFIALCFSSVLIAQTDKLIAAFTKSIEQEKKEEYLPAIETMRSLGDTTSYETVLRLGWLYYKAGLNNKSIDYYKRAIDAKPNAIEPRYGFGYPAYLTDYNMLVEQDKKILEIDPNNKLVNGNLGSLYYYHKEYAKALPHFEKIVSLYPFEYENNLNLAWTYLSLEKNAEAEKYFNMVLLYSPNDKSALDGLSRLKTTANEKLTGAFYKSYEFSEKLDYKNAIVPLKEVYDKTSYVINLRLGWLCYLAGLQTESVNYYKTAAGLMPNAIEPKLGAVYPASVLGNKNDIKLLYEDVLKLDPLNTYSHYNLGLIDYYKKDYLSALTHFEKVVSLYPCDTDGLLMLGWTNLQMTRPTEAQAFFNKVLCLSPNNASALLGLKSKPGSETKKKTGF